MKKILILFSFLFLSCSKNKTTYLDDTIGGCPVALIEIDGCEYLIIDNRTISHKGNCKYCNNSKKEIDSLKTELKNCEDAVYVYEKINDSLFWNK